MHAIIFDIWHVRTVGFVEGKGTVLEHETVYGVDVGDTCQAFLAINPYIVCDKIFVGQWVCVDGKVN